MENKNQIINSDNTYAGALRFMGWAVIVLGLIGAYTLGSTYTTYYGDFNSSIFIIGAVSSIMSGLLILGIAEIVRILHDSRHYLSIIAGIGSEPNNVSANMNTISEELPEL